MDATTLKIATATCISALFTGCATIEAGPSGSSPQAIRAEAQKMRATTPAAQELYQAEKEYISAGVDFYKQTGALPNGVRQDSCALAQQGSSTGATVGALGGGVIGNQVGGKNNKGTMTILGAIGGAVAGKYLYDADAAAKLARDCRMLQAISKETGGRFQVQGTHINPNQSGYGGPARSPFGGAPAFPTPMPRW